MSEKTQQKIKEKSYVKTIMLYKLENTPNTYTVKWVHSNPDTRDYRVKHFKTIESANNFLKILYNHAESGFYHNNSTMQEYDSKSWKSYFFMPENNFCVPPKKSTSLSCIDLLLPLKTAHRKLFGYYPIYKSDFDKIHENLKSKFNDTMELLYPIGISCIVFGGIIGSSGVIYCLATRKQRQIEKEVKIYEKTFPNYNDTIRLAITDEEIAHAINKREQVKLQIEHYRDSLMNEKSK